MPHLHQLLQSRHARRVRRRRSWFRQHRIHRRWWWRNWYRRCRKRRHSTRRPGHRHSRGFCLGRCLGRCLGLSLRCSRFRSGGRWHRRRHRIRRTRSNGRRAHPRIRRHLEKAAAAAGTHDGDKRQRRARGDTPEHPGRWRNQHIAQDTIRTLVCCLSLSPPASA